MIGAGQAGLCVSHELTSAGVDHVVLERGKVGQSWRDRWDNFFLVLPNWTVKLSGQPYIGRDPDGFMRRDDFVQYLVDYAASSNAPVREGVNVVSISASRKGGFQLTTTKGDIWARRVIVATGGYQKPYWPAGVKELSKSRLVLDVHSYTNPQELPTGSVLVVGSGQSGCQIAEDLRLAGREVFLSCGRAPWLPRRIGDRDGISWLIGTPFLEKKLEELPSPEARLLGNLQMSGRDGGHDLNFRTLQAMGVHLVGHFRGVRDGRAWFAPDLAESVAYGDARYAEIRDVVRDSAKAKGLPTPSMPMPKPFSADPPDSIPIAEIGVVIVTSGFRPEYTEWIKFPSAFDEMGFPLQKEGLSSVIPGLYFLGVHFQRTRLSATLLGVSEDARVVANSIASGGETLQ